MSQAASSPSLQPLQGLPLIIGTIGVALASLMNVVDSTITNVSLSAISGDLGASPSQGTWVITSYTAANAITVLLSGWLAQRIGQVRLIVLAVLLFALSSLCCAMSPTLGILIFFRIVQGLSAGPMVSMGQPLLMQIYPQNKIAVALAAWTSTIMLGPVAGPLLGGYLTDNLSWHWIFYINIPIAVISAWMVVSVYRKRESPVSRPPIDFVGLLLTVTWVGALQIVADKGRELDWFSSDLILALTVLAAVAFGFFLVWELTDDHPVVDLSLFKSRNYTVAVALFGVSYATVFGANIIQPLWLLQYQGYTAIATGWVLMSTSVVGFLVMPLVGRLIQRGDPRIYATVSFVLIALTFYMRASFTSGADTATLIAPLLVLGLALSIYNIPLMLIAYTGQPAAKLASASGIMNFVRYFLAALAASMLTTFWDQRSTLHHAHLVESLSASNPAASEWVAQLQRVGLDATQTMAALDRVVAVESAVMGANDIYWISALLILSGVVFIWMTRRVGAAAASVKTEVSALAE